MLLPQFIRFNLPVQEVVHFVRDNQYVLPVGPDFGANLVIGQGFLERVERSDKDLFDDTHVDLAPVPVSLLSGAQLDTVIEQGKDVVMHPVLLSEVQVQAVPIKKLKII